MLRAFFDIREDSYDIFDGPEIMNDSEAVEKWMNRCPVIYLTFKNIDGLDFDSAMAILHYKVAELIASYRAVADTAMSGNEKEILHRILDGECSNDDVRLSLSALAKLLYNHYGKKVIFILDEYDVPLDKAEKNGYYSEMLDIIRTMFLSVLKDCPYTEKGILTGCLRISRESLFTGLNNLTVYSVTGKEYESAFGFTENEVMKILHEADLEDKADIVNDLQASLKAWT